MPSALTYPGVYVEEVPSGVRTIVGVPTSVAAFVGRARRGPVHEPVVVFNSGDYERTFGGLWADSTMSFAVRDFFRNGGGQAVIVRGYARGTGTGTTSGAAQLVVDSAANLTLEASSPGAWGDALRARIDYDVRPGDASLFNLTLALVQYDESDKVRAVAEVETHRNVSLLADHPRRVDLVLASESKLARATSAFVGVATAGTRPAASATADATKPLWGKESGNATSLGVADAARGSDGVPLTETDLTGGTSQADHTGLYALDRADIFNLLCIPPHRPHGDGGANPDLENALIESAIAYCRKRRAIFLIDPPRGWRSRAETAAGVDASPAVIGSASRNAAVFFPRLRAPNPERGNLVEDFAPCGAVAGVCARTDGERGVWKAPAGLAATLVGAPDLSVRLTDDDIGALNPLGVNCLRAMPDAGRVVWGSRTREGADRLASEWKYLPVRRLTLFIEESLYRGTQWVVFEPNDEPLWSSIRLNVGAFMHSLYRQGAFQGRTPREAYEVQCDDKTTTQDDINRGVVNVVVRFAPLKPAEFVVIKIQQLAGQVQA